MAVIVTVTTPIAARLLLSTRAATGARPPLTLAYLATNLLCAGAAAILGGWLAARFSATSPLGHGLALAALVAVMGLVSMRQSGASGQPRWYVVVLAAVMPLLVLAGAWFRR
jgi:hypothetical protein